MVDKNSDVTIVMALDIGWSFAMVCKRYEINSVNKVYKAFREGGNEVYHSLAKNLCNNSSYYYHGFFFSFLYLFQIFCFSSLVLGWQTSSTSVCCKSNDNLINFELLHGLALHACPHTFCLQMHSNLLPHDFNNTL